MNIVGFDFGTTNTVISRIEEGVVRNYFDSETGQPIPSVVCYDGVKKIVGREAKKRLSTAGQGVHGNIVRSPKSDLDKDTLIIEGVPKNVIDIVTDIILGIKEQISIEDCNFDTAVVTIPVNFDGRRRKALRAAFHQAGMRVKQFIHEPLAALYGYIRNKYGSFNHAVSKFGSNYILVFDWGGGTLDLTLCRIFNGQVMQLQNQGTDDVGGDHFDVAIKNAVIKRVREIDKIPLDVEFTSDAEARLLSKCESAKIELSTRESAVLFVPNFFQKEEPNDLKFLLERSLVQEIVDRLVRSGIKRISDVLDRAEIKPPQVGLCLATGGMVNMPIICSRLYELFGASQVEFSCKTGASIAEGAAWIAHDKTVLVLARDLEVSLARNSYLPIVKAGTRMPLEDNVHSVTHGIYCVDPRDGCAKINYTSPIISREKSQLTDQRDHLGFMTLEVDSNSPPFNERLNLESKIDQDLIFHGSVVSLLTKKKETISITGLEFALPIGVQ